MRAMNDDAIITGDKPVAKSHAGTMVPDPVPEQSTSTTGLDAIHIPTTPATVTPIARHRKRQTLKKRRDKAEIPSRVRVPDDFHERMEKARREIRSKSAVKFERPAPDFSRIKYENLLALEFEFLTEDADSWKPDNLMIAQELLLERKSAALRARQAKRRLLAIDEFIIKLLRLGAYSQEGRLKAKLHTVVKIVERGT